MDKVFQMSLCDCTEEDVPLMRKPYKITERMALESEKLIMEWYDKQPHLPKNALDIRFLRRYLALCGFSVEKTKIKIDNYFSVRTLMEEDVFINRQSAIPNIVDDKFVLEWSILPRMTKERHRIIISRLPSTDASMYNPLINIKLITMLADLKMHYDTSVGEEVVIDYSNAKTGHFIRLTPVLAKKTIFLFQNSYPSRVKGIHFVNAPSMAYNVITLAKTVLKKKLVERIHIHQSLKDLHAYIPAEFLPTELGGSASSLPDVSENIMKIVKSEEWQKWFKDSENIKSDESKRINKTEDRTGELLGITGSFRRLDID